MKNDLNTEVLFQKIGTCWYIFAEVDNDVIYSSLPAGMDPRETSLELYHIIEDHLLKVSDIQNQKTDPESKL